MFSIIQYLLLILYTFRFCNAFVISGSINGIVGNVKSQCQLGGEVDNQNVLNMFKKILFSKYEDQNIKNYSGFRIYRKITLQLDPISLISDMHFVACQDGQLIWETIYPFQEDIDWSTPICLFDSMGTVNDTLKVQATSNISRYYCFKFARSRKYSQRDYTLYFPGRIIGGLFLCNLSDEQKYQMLNNSRDDLAIINKTFAREFCVSNNTIPLLPLIADNLQDCKTTWENVIKLNWDKSKTIKMVKILPYIHTLNAPKFLHSRQPTDKYRIIGKLFPTMHVNAKYLLDHRFEDASVWFDGIEVNEEYAKSIENNYITSFKTRLINSLGKYVTIPRNKLKKSISGTNN
ncbi:hypothetical protein RNJ44_00958 [Nakaseomyces bracarensis]|uniref:Uncharacterized protein n=1 Tax=Nakaseomyces bracarensis TaxID=273131 RepID=A0ABR4NQH3_9SACH